MNSTTTTVITRSAEYNNLTMFLYFGMIMIFVWLFTRQSNRYF